MSADCYENAVEYMYRRKQLNDMMDLTLVQGIVTGTGGEVEGVQYGHAWVEEGDICIDVAADVDSPVYVRKDTYYEVGKIDPDMCNRYDHYEMAVAMLEWEHYGPWDDEHMAICEVAEGAVQ
jgi:hypothetical protein